MAPAQQDLTTVTQWLQNHNLSVTYISKDHLAITFEGSAAQVQNAFHTEIHNLDVKGEKHIANMSDPKVPEALSPVVVGVKALHNFFPHPMHKRVGGEVRRNADGTWTRIETPSTVVAPKTASRLTTPPAKSIEVKEPKPLFGTGGTPATLEDVAPYDFATIYNVLPLWNASTPIDGTGQKIAIAGTSNINLADVATFRTAFGLPIVGSTYPTYKAPTVIVTNTDPGVCPTTDTNYPNCLGDLIENTLDVEWSGAVAKNAQITLVTSSITTATTDNLFASEQYIVDHVVAPVMNVSYGECELGLGTAGNTEYNTLWSTAQAAGIAVFVSSGDEGSASCDAGSVPASGPYGAQYGLSVSGFTSTPYNTSVGGTDLNWSWVTNGETTYWGTSNAANNSNALGYIPESPWNSTCSNNLLVDALNSSNNLSYTATQWCDYLGTEQITSQNPDDEQSFLDLVNVAGGSGGASSCIDGDGSTVASCTKGYPKPNWQAGVTGIVNDGVRDVPDISFFASSGFSGSAYVICVSNPGVGTCSYTQGTEPTGEEYGGTSISSPAMAGVMALVNQKSGSAQGNPNVEMYKLAAKQNYGSCSSDSIPLTGSSCVFNDITTGTIAMPCDVGAPNCVGTDVYGLLSGYDSNVGYDAATGLGSLNVANFVNAYAATASTSPVVALSPTTLTFAAEIVGATTDPTQVATLTNSGPGSLTISGITITGAALGSFSETNNCGTSLAASASCAITVAFKPAAVGTLNAVLNVTDNGTASPQTVALVGTGLTSDVVSTSATALTFASTLIGTKDATQSFDVKNTGTSTVALTSIAVTGTNASSFSQTNTCGASLAAAASCTVTVTFDPIVAGNLSAAITITDSSSGNPPVVTLTGIGVAPTPIASLKPSSLTFPSTGVGVASTAQLVTLANTGTAPLIVTAITIGGTNASSFALTPANTCVGSIAPSATCTISVTFTPAALGTLTGTISVTDNAAGSPQTVSLTGTGAEPSGAAFALAAPALAVTHGTPGTETVTVTSTNYIGTVNLTCSVAPLTGGIDTPTCTGATAATVTSVGGTGTGTLTIGSTASTSSARAASQRAQLEKRKTAGRWAGVGSIAVAGLLLFGIPARRRNWRSILGVLVLMTGIGILSGCGGGSHTPTGTTPGTYTVTVTGADSVTSTITGSTTFTLTVN